MPDAADVEIDVDVLPELMQNIAELIGVAASINLVRVWGGVRLYIPASAGIGHTIANVIGQQELETLCAEYGGETITLPAINNVDMQLKYRQIKKLLAEGVSNRDVALRTGYTQRHIERIRRQFREDNQLDLFGE